MQKKKIYRYTRFDCRPEEHPYGNPQEPVKVRVMPPNATMEDLEAAVQEDDVVSMTDEQAEALDARLNEGVTPDGVAL